MTVGSERKQGPIAAGSVRLRRTAATLVIALLATIGANVGIVAPAEALPGSLGTSFVRTIGTGVQPYQPRTDGSSVWVANRGGDAAPGTTVTQVNAATGNVVRTIQVGNGAVDAVPDGSHVWVVLAHEAKIVELDAATGQQVGALSLPNPASGLVVDGPRIWVLVGSDLLQFDAQNLSLLRTVHTGWTGEFRLDQSTLRNGHLWYLEAPPNGIGDFFLVDSLSSDGSVVSTRRLFSLGGYDGGDLGGFTVDSRYAYASYRYLNQMQQFDLSTGLLVRTYSTHSFPVSVLSNDAHVWLSTELGSDVQEFDVQTGQPVGSAVGVPNGALGLTLYGRQLWVANYLGSSITELDGGDPAMPLPPTGVSAVAGNGSVTISWSAPASDGGSPITGYTVTLSPGGATCSTQIGIDANPLSCSLSGLTAGTAYAVSVVAQNAVASSAPASLEPAPQSTQFVVGHEFGCALSYGAVHCWGSYHTAAEVPTDLPPVTALTDTQGGGEVCALLVTHTVRCWGDEYYPGMNAWLQSKTDVYGVALSGHPCVTVSADRHVECFGQNDHGQASPPAITGVTNIAANAWESCAIATGQVICWGWNHIGQGSPPTFPSTPVGLIMYADTSCAVLANADLWCWGQNEGGQISPSQPNGWPPGLARARVATRVTTSQVAMGWYSICYIDSSSTVQCSGSGSYGGVADPGNRPFTNNAVSLSGGFGNYCALISDLSISCWGPYLTSVSLASVQLRSLLGAQTFTPVQGVPDPPVGVRAVSGDGAASVSWTAPANDGGSPITSYSVTSSPTGASCAVSGVTAACTGLANGTSYTFTVVATNASGDSLPSVASSPVTPAQPQTVTSLIVNGLDANGATGSRISGLATVTTTAGPAVSSGDVNFYLDGSVTPFAMDVTPSDGYTFTLDTTGLSVGAHTLTASYAGTSSYPASSSNSVTFRFTNCPTCSAVTEIATPSPFQIASTSDGTTWFDALNIPNIYRVNADGTTTVFPIPAPANGITQGADGAIWFSMSSMSRIGRIDAQGVVTDYYVGAAVTKVLSVPDGSIWFTDQNYAIGKLASDGTVTNYSLFSQPFQGPNGLTLGSDGNVWFALRRGPSVGVGPGALGRITPTGDITEFNAGLPSNAVPNTVALGPDGNVWFTDQNGGVGKITVDGQITEYTKGISPGAGPRLIATGHDGALWFTEANNGLIGRITTAGDVTEMAPSGLSSAVAPQPMAPNAVYGNNLIGISVGADGRIWVAETNVGQLASFTSGFANYAGPASATEIATGGSPYLLTTAPDGSIWYDDQAANVVGRIDRNGIQAVYPVSSPAGLTVDSQGNVWVATQNNRTIIRIDSAGNRTGFPVSVQPSKLVLGPDGNIWFSDLGNEIGKLGKDGSVTLYNVAVQGYYLTNFLTVGADGNIWFVLRSGAATGAIGRITTGGQLSVFSKGLLPKAFPNCMTLGPDGNVWFTDQIGAVGKVTVDGRITEYTAGMSPNARPRMIASGQDGALWVTESANGRIARVTTGGVITELSPTGLSAALAPVAPVGAAFGNNVIGITSSADGTLWVAEGVLGRIAMVNTGYANVATGFSLGNIQTSIEPGTLILSTPYSPGSPLILPPMTLNDAATEYATSANFASIAVADTRPGNLPYTVSAIASPLVKAGVPTPSVDETISSENVGLTNLQLVSTNSTPSTFVGGQIFGLFSGPENFVGFDNAAAAHVPADDAGSHGLGGSSPHPVLHANSGLGRTETSGTLSITAPTNTRDGTYNGTLTFSIIGS